MATGDSGQTGSAEPVFRTVKRGFDPEQVLEYLKQLGTRVQGLETQLGQAHRDLEEARARGSATPPDPYAGVSAHVASLLRGFDEEVERARTKAEADAGRIQAEAKAKADLEIEQARETAERIRLDQERLRDSTSSGLRSMRDHMARSLREIEEALQTSAATPETPGKEAVMVLHEADQQAAAGVSVPNPPSEAG